MSGRLVTSLLAVALFAGAVQVSARGVGESPALGPLLNPASGVWSTARAASMPSSARATIPGLDGEVRVTYDDRGVPHIFAASARDAYRALGYVVARDRLFQLEVQWRAGAGRLTELVGPRALEIDRFTRGIGLPAAAERKLAGLDSGSSGWEALHSYADGVNAFIDGMNARDMPMEYWLLGTRPSRWEPINSLHLLNRMGQTLSFNPTEMLRLRAASLIGWEATDVLFPFDSPIQEPVQPTARSAPRVDFPRIPPPGQPASDTRQSLRMMQSLLPPALLDVEPGSIGSNSWAVSPGRAAADHALLAGDPHLELTLPSIWYEVHIVVPDELDVYGVTIPGAPWVIIGFNRDVAWTFTNHDADVVDFYQETVDESSAPSSYLLDGAWEPLAMRVEEYRGTDGRAIATDTLRYSHRGPLRRVSERWLSLRWTVYEPWLDEEVFPAINRASSAEAFVDAIRGWVAPSQNMLVADRRGAIAVRSPGFFPIRPEGRRGDVIQDGRTRASDWVGWRAVEAFPFAMNPAQGYLATANQQSIDPQVRGGYFGTVWPSPWRALRINELLRADSAVTADAMRRYQTDAGSARADMFVPAFLAAAAARPGLEEARRAALLLARWDRRYTKENDRAVLFEEAMRELARRTWDELIERDGTQLVATPGDVMLAVLLTDPTNVWWDDRRTAARETRDDVLAASLAAALATVSERHGPPDEGGWRWDRRRHANVQHPLQLPALSALQVPVQGGPGLLNPSFGDGRHGASWRMVVELAEEPRGWSIYPGGQSGHPLSTRYRDRIATWSSGELEPVLVPRAPEDLPARRVSAQLRLTGARR